MTEDRVIGEWESDQPKYFWLHAIMLFIWTAIAFMIGMSWQQPDCEVRVYRHLETDHIVTACVVEPSSKFEVNTLNETTKSD